VSARDGAAGAHELVLHGELYLTLAGVAERCTVRLEWIEELYEYGLLGEGERVGDEIAIAAALLDRVARIRRLHEGQGVNLPGIAIILDLLEGEP
jgi:hypothetical protein